MEDNKKMFISWKEIAAYVVYKTGADCEIADSDFKVGKKVYKFDRTEDVKVAIREYYDAKDNNEPLMVDVIKYNQVRDNLYRRYF